MLFVAVKLRSSERLFSRYLSGSNGYARCWDSETLEQIGPSMRSQLSAMHSLDLSPDDRRLATGSVGGLGTIWDASNLKELGAIQVEGAYKVQEVKFATYDILIVRGGRDYDYDVLRAPSLDELLVRSSLLQGDSKKTSNR